jgi:uncharacterized membrane protein YgdD (TMEM256/DUF423 family)
MCFDVASFGLAPPPRDPHLRLMSRIFLLLASISALLGVAGGAFGAHLLSACIPPDLLAVYETGIRYQLVHALAMALVALAADRWPDRLWARAGWLFASGTVLFSGSLYALSLSGIRWLGAITPLGGICFLVGWLFCATSVARSVR